MKRLLMTVFFGGLGVWIGSNRWLPLRCIVALAALGAVLWGLGEWLEHRGGSDDDSR
ncbi:MULTISPECIES: hypothetical protein [unclassified Pseudomonas]|uniref:hypothetical protein n=1 Tax=unclassified Pseudomonas TaxID=196821 RepID=UPI00200BFCB8|nr:MULTISPECIES: hypothetical protein [unclassified Pseudomonas]